MILHQPEERPAMEMLLRFLMEEPIEGLTVLVVLHSDYINELLRDYLKEKISQSDIANHVPRILEGMAPLRAQCCI